MTFSGKLTTNYAAELTVASQIRRLKDGLTIINLDLGFDWYKGDHCPRFKCALFMFNHTIFEFSIYNVNHVDDDDLEYQTYK
jgi:hypothetical protein